MTPEEVIAKVKARAKSNFKTGLNCAECVLEAVLSEVDTGLPLEPMCLMTGFGGGRGHFGDTCGALVGGIAALGAVYGRREIPPNPKAGNEETARAARPLQAIQPPAQRIQGALRQHPVPGVDRPGKRTGSAGSTTSSAATWWSRWRGWPRRWRRPGTWPAGAPSPSALNTLDTVKFILTKIKGLG